MKITKLVHSCLLIEKGDTRIIVDPGNFSWASGLVNDTHLTGVKYVVITHSHPDHFDQDFAKAIAEKSPNAKWYSTTQVANTAKSLGVTIGTNTDNDIIKFVQSEHADLSPWYAEQPEHTSLLLFDEILIGGDCHTLTEVYGARIFAPAITAPWGGVVSFAKSIEAMNEKPAVILPLHDWHQNEQAKAGLYTGLAEFLNKYDIKFVPLENGKTEEI